MSFQPSRAAALEPKAIAEGVELRPVIPGKNNSTLSLQIQSVKCNQLGKLSDLINNEYV